MPMNFAGSLALSASDVIGKVEVLEPKIDVGHHRLRLGGGLGLHLAVLEHRLDDEVDAGQRVVIGGRGDLRQHRVALPPPPCARG